MTNNLAEGAELEIQCSSPEQIKVAEYFPGQNQNSSSLDASASTREIEVDCTEEINPTDNVAELGLLS